MQKSLLRLRRGAIGVALSALVISGMGVAPAYAATTDTSQAEGSALSGEGLINLDAVLKDASAYSFTTPDAPAAKNDMDLTLLSGLDLPLGEGLDIELLRDILSVGAVGQYGSTAKGEEAVAAAGVVTGDGLLSVSPSDADHNSYVKVTPLLKGLGLDSVIDKLELQLKALGGRASALPGKDATGEYKLAGGDLTLSAPLVGSLSTDLNTAVGGIQNTLNTALGANGLIGAAGLQSITNSLLGVLQKVPGLNLLARIDPVTLKVTANVNLKAATDAVLASEFTSQDKAVNLDLGKGLVYVDITKLVGSDDPEYIGTLNGFGPNTELLTADSIASIRAGLVQILADVQNKLVAAVLKAVNDTAVTIDIGTSLSIALGVASGDVKLKVSTRIGDLIGAEGYTAHRNPECRWGLNPPASSSDLAM